MSEKRLLIIIPAYNEADSLTDLIPEIQTVCPSYDYVIINDGSTDHTRKVCADNGFNMLDLPVNVGLGGAVRAGMKYASFHDYDYAVQIDGDGQHEPEYIEDMLACMERTGADIVIGSRFKTEHKPFNMRMIGSQLITYAIMLTTRGTGLSDVTSGMRLFNKKLIKQFSMHLNYMPEPDTLAYLINHGIKVEEVQVHMRDRKTGKSYLDAPTTVKYMLHVLLNIFLYQWVRKD